MNADIKCPKTKRRGGGKRLAKMKSKVYERDNWCCQICYKKLDKNLLGTNDQKNPALPNIDHIIPLSKGGTYTIKNLQAVCRKCNAEKDNKL